MIGRLVFMVMCVVMMAATGCNDVVVATIGGPTGGILTGHVASECHEEGFNLHDHSISGAMVEVRDADHPDHVLARGRTAWNGDFWLSGVPADADVVVLVRGDDHRGEYEEKVRTYIDKFGFGYAGTIYLPVPHADVGPTDGMADR